MIEQASVGGSLRAPHSRKTLPPPTTFRKVRHVPVGLGFGAREPHSQCRRVSPSSAVQATDHNSKHVTRGWKHSRWSRFRRTRPTLANRSGSVLVVVLVCFAIVMAILGTMLQGTLRARRQLRTERDLRQTELMLQAGADRAALRLFTSNDYRGETWELPADSIIGHRNGQVTMEAFRNSDEKPWQIRVIAEYGPGSPWSIRRTRSFHFPQNRKEDP